MSKSETPETDALSHTLEADYHPIMEWYRDAIDRTTALARSLERRLSAATQKVEQDVPPNCTTDELRGTRLVGPHEGLKQYMPNPTEDDLSDPLFETIWQATKTWDVNAPEYYVGYCGMNGSHVMLIVNAIRALSTRERTTQEDGNGKE